MRKHIGSSTGAYTDYRWPQIEGEWLFISSYQLSIINPHLEVGPQGPSAIHGWLLLLCWSYLQRSGVGKLQLLWGDGCNRHAMSRSRSSAPNTLAHTFFLPHLQQSSLNLGWGEMDTDSPFTAECSLLFLLGTATSDESLHWPQPTASCDVKWDSCELPRRKKCTLRTSSQLFL